MKTLFTLWFGSLLMIGATAFCFGDNGTIQDPSTKKSFPSVVTFQNNDAVYTLNATGVCTRTKFIFNIYSAFHYLQNPVVGSQQTVLNQIFDDSYAKQFTFAWVYDVDAKRIQSTFIESLQKNLTKEQFSALKADIDQFLGYYSDGVKVDDIHILRWLPGGIIETEMNGEIKGTIINVNFANALWNVWLGPNTELNRTKLLSLVVN